jgi:ABC-type lipoprotein export system ATPase subunit
MGTLSALPAPDHEFIKCKQVVRAYKIDKREIVALRGIDFTMRRGEFVCIIGPSGAGKSSLLNLLGGLDKPTAGQLSVDGFDLLALKGGALTRYRLREVGFLWQQTTRNLLPGRSALRNVTLPMALAGVAPWKRAKRAKELLEAVGLKDQMHKRPALLSGGQQQRVAMAVALANQPKLLLADEPTGELDAKTARQMVDLLQRLRQEFELTILMVTHDPEMAAQADRVLTLRDGALGQDLTGGDNSPQLDAEGKIKLPEAVRAALGGAARVAVEIRPEGILLRPESNQGEDGHAGQLLLDALPADAAPEKRGLFGRKKKKK